VALREGAGLDGVWSALREYTDPSAAGIALVKLAVPPARSTAALSTARAAARDHGFAASVLAHAGSGVIYLKLLSDTWDADAVGRLASVVTSLRGYARGDGGSVVLEACPTAAKIDGIDPWGDVGSGFPVMRALKQNLDPKGTLNPGRFVGGL
jgi:glycolate oxidase FAD binding subunit